MDDNRPDFTVVGDRVAQPAGPRNADVLEGESVSITGTLASMTHEQAFQQIAACGGTATPHLSRQTTMLVIGEEGWPLDENGQPSAKLRHAEELIADGLPIRVVGETEWLSLLGLYQENPDVHRLYTPAMLSQLLRLPVQLIRGWERAGLIRAEKRIFRLPYFSYHEVTTARRLSELLQSGISQQELTRSFAVLNKFLPDPHRVLEQLELLSDHHRLVIRDQHGFLEPQTRQRLFSFEESERMPADSSPSLKLHSLNQDELDSASNADQGDYQSRLLRFEPSDKAPSSSTDWMIDGCRKAEVGDTTAAIRSFRQALRIRPDDAEAHFYLADALFRLGSIEAALERYLAATEHDPEYLEAWNQVGCLYAELNKWSDALIAFDAALEIYPQFAETHLHKAETLLQMKRQSDAIEHWQLYLKYDDRGPWAELVHQRLEQAGVAANADA